MNTLLLFFLSFFAKKIIQKHKPYVIGVTGTIGKTTLTTYIANYLELIYGEEHVGISPYHYNGEYGLPLSIIWAKTGGKNPLLWIGVFFQFCRTYIRPYPKYLILEYGIDHPGEMEFLLSIVQPDIAILTPVAPNHLEQFGTLEKYREAKLLLGKSAKDIFIAHDSHRPYIKSDSTLFYGQLSDSQAHIVSATQDIRGIIASIDLYGKIYSCTLPSFWLYQAENILPVYLIGSFLKTDLQSISEKSSLFLPEPGRSQMIEWIHDSIIIDGSYNGWFESICRGIDSVLPFLSTHTIIMFLWDMRELWSHAEKIHGDLWEYILENFRGHPHVSLFLVWPLMQQYVYSKIKDVIHTKTSLSSRQLGIEIEKLLKENTLPTIVYVKWSQNTIFLEEGIKSFLKNPQDSTLLCRQSRDWMVKKETFFTQVEK